MSEPSQHSDGSHRTETPSAGYAPVIGWAVVLVVAAVAAVLAVWQVNEQLYAPETTAETYWESLSAGDGSEALGLFHSVPEFTQDGEVDNVLLSGPPLSHSAELIDSADITEADGGAELDFTAADQSYSTELPLARTGTSWGFFDTWEVAPSAITWFEVDVPGAPRGGIGQVQVNGEPVNLDEETARLSAYVPTVAEISIDSQWLSGSATHVVTSADDDEESSAERVTLELTASEEAARVFQDELSSYFENCDQQVLMPAGCPVGTTTLNRVDPDTISWSFPEAETFSLTFDAESWQVTHGDLVAEVSFDAIHHHTGEQVRETAEVPFELDVQVGASGDDLVVSIDGTTP
jgi:hypothetical protein